MRRLGGRLLSWVSRNLYLWAYVRFLLPKVLAWVGGGRRNAFSPSAGAICGVRFLDVAAFGVLLKRVPFKSDPTQGSSEKKPAPARIESSRLYGGRQAGMGPFGAANVLRGHPRSYFWYFRVFYKRVSIENLLKADLRPAPSCGFTGTHDAMNVLGAPCQVRFSLFLSFVDRISSKAWPRLARLGQAKPGMAWPGLARPNQAWPGRAMPGQARPGQARPGQA